MSEIAIGKGPVGSAGWTVLSRWKNGEIGDAIDCFAEEFRFKDHGIGLEFSEKERLAEFFRKTRELYPDSSLQTDAIFVSDDHVIVRWSLHVTLTEPFYGQLSRKVSVDLQGVSIVRTDNGKVTDWADYYDGLAVRRTALASYFKGGGEAWREGWEERIVERNNGDETKYARRPANKFKRLDSRS